MLPLVINDDPSRLVQVAMNGSVGAGGTNQFADVRLVQLLLNAVPSNDGGPVMKLAVDGRSGPLTIAAIRRFQQARTRVVDGRVDPYGRTIRTLVALLNARNALPNGLPNLGPPKIEVSRALNFDAARAIVQSRADREGGAVATATKSGSKAMAFAGGGAPLVGFSTFVGKTGWDFVTSSSASISVPWGSAGFSVGVTIINIFLKHDIEPGLTYRFSFAGSGVGLSKSPIGLGPGGSFSTQDMASFGTQIRKINPLLGKTPPIFANDFDLLPTTILAGELNGPGFGGGGDIIFFGAVGPFLPLTRYLGAIIGEQVATPGPGLSLWTGAIAGWS